jgi:threonine dehydrogenase-like Zn-dependent dehydrogenase
VRALTFHSPGQILCEEVPEPVIEQPTDALVRVRLAGLCGSDLHVYRGHETGLDAGTVMGHELVGEVMEVGSEVSGISVGDAVVSPFTTSCGQCFYCRRGLTCRCLAGELFGWVEGGRGLQGAQGELVRVPLAASTLVPLPPEVLADNRRAEAALFAGDVLATGYFCAEQGNVGPGTVVVVLGCGPVGLMAVLGARRLGAAEVLAVDAVPERLELAEGFGARPVPLGDDPGGEVRRLTDGRGADSVLEAAGGPQALRLGMELLRPGGTLSAAAVHTEARLAFSPAEAYDKNLTFRTGRCPARHYLDQLLPWALSGEVNLSAIVSHRLPLAGGPRAYEIFDKKLEGCTKVVLKP